MKILNDLPINSLSPLPLIGVFKNVFFPQNIYEFVSLMQEFDREEINYVVFGKGTNVLPISSVIFTPIIVYKEKILTINEKQIIVSGNMDSYTLGKKTFEKGISNFIGSETIPGTIGAGIKNNASYLRKDYLSGLKSLYIYKNGKTFWSRASNYSFSYRKSNIDGIILFASYKVINEESLLKERSLYFNSRKKQAIGPNLGSVFLNPKDDYAFKYILDIKDKLDFDDVTFSSVHANFFSFKKKTYPERVLNLVNTCKKLVFERCGVELELEIKLIK